MTVVAVVLAAGLSRRMGVDKLALDHGGERLLYRSLAPYCSAAGIDAVLLVVQPGFAWPDHPARCRLVENPRFAEGIGTSLAAGIAAAGDADTYLVALADMPGLSMATLGRLLAAGRRTSKKIVRPFYKGRAGHPVLFHRDLREELLRCSGDIGARQLVQARAADLLRLDCDDPGVVLDLDSPADRLRQPLPRLRVLIRGAGEMASAVAHLLFQCGLSVVMTDQARPTAIRRLVCFASAIHHQETTVEGVRAIAYHLDQAGQLEQLDGSHIPVVVDPEGELIRRWCPDVLIDARLLKRPAGSPGDAPLVIGLGPGFRAGSDVHLVVETNRGHNLARLICEGTAEPDTGVPGAINGCTEQRIVRAPASGPFEPACEIGAQLAAGDLVGRVGGRQITVAIAGVVRGLIAPGAVVTAGQKIGDIDPRGEVSYCTTISEKARAIAGTCLAAIMSTVAGAGSGDLG